MAMLPMVTAHAAATALQQTSAGAASAAPAARRDLPWPPNGDLAAVSVDRRVDGASVFSLWTVLVDGQPAGTLGLGEQLQFCVHPGRHVIDVTGGRARGQSTFDTVGGEIVELRCRTERAGGLRLAIVIEERPDPGRIVGNGPVPES